jgi:adenylate cyclase
VGRADGEAGWWERRYPLVGLFALFERTADLKRTTLLILPLAAANVAIVGTVSWIYDRPGMAVVNFALAAAYMGGVWVGLRSPHSRLNIAVTVYSSLAGNITAHIIMGGYGYSGGYLLWGIFVVTGAAAGLGRREAVSIALIYAVAGVVLGFFESTLRTTRPPPDPALPTFLIVDVFVATLAMVGPMMLLTTALLTSAYARNRELMLSILPETVADRLKSQPGMIADRFDACTIVFADLVGFTAYSKGKDPETIVGMLNTIFTRFDALAAQHGAEKIKTIGDGYMAATSLPDPDPDHVAHACDLALAMLDAMPTLNAQLATSFQLRVGVNTGSAVAGVVGTSKFSYDVWGDTVNLASRLESNGTPGQVVASAAVAASLDARYRVDPSGVRDLKGHGPTDVYRVARAPRALV